MNNINTTAGIIFTNISDHLPYFLSIERRQKIGNQKSKLVKKQINTTKATESLMEELSSTDIYSRLKRNLDNNPNENYEIMSNIIKNAKAKHFPSRFVKYNKHRHKGNKWITLWYY